MRKSITSADEVSQEQIEQFSRLVKDASLKSTETAIEQLVADSELGRESLQRAIGKGNQLKQRLVPFLKELIKELATEIKGCLKLISAGQKLVISKTSGKENLAHAKDVFRWIDRDFENYGCNVEDKPREETPVQVFEMAEDADFKGIFGGFNISLDEFCLTQHQIKTFVKEHQEWLRTDGYATFFLFKVGNEFFVASVCWLGCGLRVYVDRFSYGSVWYAGVRPRVVVPQLTLVNSFWQSQRDFILLQRN